MKKLLLILCVIPLIFYGQTYITSDTTWINDQDFSGNFNIAQNVIVEEGVTLTIKEGVVIKMGSQNTSSNYFIINGELVIEANPCDPVIFTANTGETWGGILINSNSNNYIKTNISPYNSPITLFMACFLTNLQFIQVNYTC